MVWFNHYKIKIQKNHHSTGVTLLIVLQRFKGMSFTGPQIRKEIKKNLPICTTLSPNINIKAKKIREAF
jgi:hypothetical protein